MTKKDPQHLTDGDGVNQALENSVESGLSSSGTSKGSDSTSDESISLSDSTDSLGSGIEIKNDNANDIIDISGGRRESANSLADSIRAGLRNSNDTSPSRRSIPHLLLWDEKGQKLFEEITQLEQYYLTRDEAKALEEQSGNIARRIKPGSLVIDMGSGNPEKIVPLLQALNSTGRSIDYFALDLCLSTLQLNLSTISHYGFTHLRCHGLLGTYDDLHTWLKLPKNIQRPKCLISLGSSIGNFTRPEAAKFLAGFADTLRRQDTWPEDHRIEQESSIIIGLDTCISGDKVRAAYKDPLRLNERFILNALEHANFVLGYEAFRIQDWTLQSEWDEPNRCLTQYLVPLINVRFEDVCLKAGERVHVSDSYKYDDVQKAQLWKKAGVKEVELWRSRDGCSDKNLLISMLEIDGSTQQQIPRP